MIRAAGILFVAPGNVALFLKRSAKGDAAGTWCFPGGRLEGDEAPEDAAKREAVEEIGFLPKGKRALWTRRIGEVVPAAVAAIPQPESPSIVPPQPPDEVDFTTFLQRVDEPFEPTLNDEHVGYAWAPIAEPPLPLHPGCQIALSRFAMNELGVARAIRDGELMSPQRYENMWLFALRISGTAVAYRSKLDEFVYRRPENYLTDEFLARCNGLPVLWEHPTKAVLDSKTFTKQIIGTMFLPYLVGDEVWGIAKVYDEGAAELMRSGQLSTSPSVVFRDETVNRKLKTEDGTDVLVEGDPSLLDHLAVCEHGVWDKGEGPTGVDAGAMLRGDSDMPTEAEMKAKADAEAAEAKKRADEQAEDQKKADADAGTKLDTILKHVDSMGKRMDAWEEKEKSRDDATKADAKKKDEDEESEKKKKEEEAKADKARKDAARKDEPGEREEMAERIKAKEKEKEKADADEKAKADADVKGRIAAMELRLPKPFSDADFATMADIQAKADSVFAEFGERAPRFLDGETPLAFRRRLATKLKDHSESWKPIDLAVLADDALAVAEKQIYADAQKAARNPSDVPVGQLRMITRVDSETGQRVNTFVGPNTFISALNPPARRVAHIGERRRD